jgi:hypothetical protein
VIIHGVGEGVLKQEVRDFLLRYFSEGNNCKRNEAACLEPFSGFG